MHASASYSNQLMAVKQGPEALQAQHPQQSAKVSKLSIFNSDHAIIAQSHYRPCSLLRGAQWKHASEAKEGSWRQARTRPGGGPADGGERVGEEGRDVLLVARGRHAPDVHAPRVPRRLLRGRLHARHQPCAHPGMSGGITYTLFTPQPATRCCRIAVKRGRLHARH